MYARMYPDPQLIQANQKYLEEKLALSKELDKYPRLDFYLTTNPDLKTLVFQNPRLVERLYEEHDLLGELEKNPRINIQKLIHNPMHQFYTQPNVSIPRPTAVSDSSCDCTIV